MHSASTIYVNHVCVETLDWKIGPIMPPSAISPELRARETSREKGETRGRSETRGSVPLKLTWYAILGFRVVAVVALISAAECADRHPLVQYNRRSKTDATPTGARRGHPKAIGSRFKDAMTDHRSPRWSRFNCYTAPGSQAGAQEPKRLSSSSSSLSVIPLQARIPRAQFCRL